jgi:hypothetical protein
LVKEGLGFKPAAKPRKIAASAVAGLAVSGENRYIGRNL